MSGAAEENSAAPFIPSISILLSHRHTAYHCPERPSQPNRDSNVISYGQVSSKRAACDHGQGAPWRVRRSRRALELESVVIDPGEDKGPAWSRSGMNVKIVFFFAREQLGGPPRASGRANCGANLIIVSAARGDVGDPRRHVVTSGCLRQCGIIRDGQVSIKRVCRTPVSAGRLIGRVNDRIGSPAGSQVAYRVDPDSPAALPVSART